MIENENVSELPTTSTTPQIQETVLKQPINQIEVTNIKAGHSLEGYCSKLIMVNKLEPVERRKMVKTDCLKPTLESASIVWKKETEDTWKCHLLVQGSFLQTVQLGAEANQSMGFPFKETSDITSLVNKFYPF